MQEHEGHLAFDLAGDHVPAKSNSKTRLKNFTLKSEYFEKDIAIDPHLFDGHGDAHDITTVKVFKGDSVEEVSYQSLQNYISKNKDIKKVVIEKISLDEASRVSLLFEPNRKKQANDRVTGEDILTFPRQASFDAEENLQENLDENIIFDKSDFDDEGNSFDLADLDDVVNASFFNDSIFVDQKKRDDDNYHKEEEKVKKAPHVGLSLKIEDESSEKVNSTFNYEKHSFTRKKEKTLVKYYYKVVDHMELYKVGSSYLRDYHSGIRSFALSSYNLAHDCQKAIMGLASFFGYQDDLNMCIITTSVIESFYAELLKDFSHHSENVPDEEFEFEFYNSNGVDFIDFEELGRVEGELEHITLEEFICYLMSKYDLVLWDLPSPVVLDERREVYFPIVRSIESLTLVAGTLVTKRTQMEELTTYFRKYEVPIKGVLFSNDHSIRSKKKNNKKKSKTQNKEVGGGCDVA